MSEYIVNDDMDVLRQWMPKLTEIVRCRDCRYFREGDRDFPDTCRLWIPRNCSLQYGIEPDGFCAWGERR